MKDQEPTVYGKAVKCNRYGAQGPEKENEEEAVKAWNKQIMKEKNNDNL